MTSTTSNNISCEKCCTTFTKKQSFYRHMKNIHTDNEFRSTNSLKCGICGEQFSLMRKFLSHISSNHTEVNLQFEEKTFYCYEDFNAWKSEVELNSQSYFVRRAESKKEGTSITYYACHRSGKEYTKKSKGERKRSRLTSSVKIGTTCPALMKVTCDTHHEAIEISVSYQSTHIGHAMENVKCRIPLPLKSEIQRLIRAGFPNRVIIDKLKEDYPQRSITRQDLYNIRKRTDDVDNKVVLDVIDASSVNAIVKKMERENVLIYKPIGEDLFFHPQIDKREFVLGFMNRTQVNLLQMYDQKAVVIHTAHDTNEYGFLLTTVMIADENLEAVPVAVLYSSVTTYDILVAFFESIKARLVDNFRVSVFLSDDEEVYYSAWQKVFQDDSKYVWCMWQTKKSFQNSLFSRVKEVEVRKRIRSDFQKLQKETDVFSFEILLRDFLNDYESECNFMTFFKEKYVPKKEKWALCYSGIDADVKLDQWHRSLRLEKGGEKILRKMKHSITVILKVICKMLIGRLIAIDGARLSSRMSAIRDRHLAARKMNESSYSLDEMVSNQVWVLTKSDDSLLSTYEVSKSEDSCSCSLRCADCRVCVHSMSCSCIDYIFLYNICEHIHLVCSKLRGPSTSENIVLHSQFLDVDQVIVIDYPEVEETEVVAEAVKRKQNINLEKEKSLLLARLENIRNEVKNTDSLETISHINEQLDSVETYLETSSNMSPTSHNSRNNSVNRPVDSPKYYRVCKIQKKK